jgi:hypothetical protein
MNGSSSTYRLVTVLGLVAGAAGCAIQWAAGAVPLPIPPGMVIMLAGALFVGWAPWRWAPAAGAVLALPFAFGFLVIPTGVPNLLGEAGPAAAFGQGIEVIGAVTAVVAGLIATSAGYRIHADAGQ